MNVIRMLSKTINKSPKGRILRRRISDKTFVIEFWQKGNKRSQKRAPTDGISSGTPNHKQKKSISHPSKLNSLGSLQGFKQIICFKEIVFVAEQ